MNESILKVLIDDPSKISKLSTYECDKYVDMLNSKFKKLSCYIDEIHPSLEELLEIINGELL